MAEPHDGNRAQEDLFEEELARAWLDDLLAESRLYKNSRDYQELLDFVVRLRAFAPFNAMLLQIQKPGLSYAASEHDWRVRFGRLVKRGARPLLILWPFGPVALVYDVIDTEGDPIPTDAFSFVVQGEVSHARILAWKTLVENVGIGWHWLDVGDRSAGAMRRTMARGDGKPVSQWDVDINKHHTPAVQFNTLVHELGHLYLGHLGPDKKLKVRDRRGLNHGARELEAESLAYVICRRHGIEPRSQTYLADFVSEDGNEAELDIYRILKAAGQVEHLLDLADRPKWGHRPSRQRSTLDP